MRTVAVCLLLVIFAAGCVSKKKAALEAQQAYINGQAQAAQQAQQRAAVEGPVVFVQGPVRNPVVPWKEDLTLSQAIVEADYTAFMNPMVVRVIRNGQVAGEFKGIDLLHHQDMGLEAGDTVVIVP